MWSPVFRCGGIQSETCRDCVQRSAQSPYVGIRRTMVDQCQPLYFAFSGLP
jgi:hypothetical protein